MKIFIFQVIDLLKSGAPSVLDAEGQTPLHLAAAAGHLSLVTTALKHFTTLLTNLS